MMGSERPDFQEPANAPVERDHARQMVRTGMVLLVAGLPDDLPDHPLCPAGAGQPEQDVDEVRAHPEQGGSTRREDRPDVADAAGLDDLLAPRPGPPGRGWWEAEAL